MTENNTKNKEKKKKQATQKGIDLVMSRAIEKVLAAESDSRGAERKREKASADAGAKKTRVRRTAAKADAVTAVVKAEPTEQPARARRGQTRLTADQPAETPSGVRKKTAAGRKAAESYKLKVIPLGGLGEVGKNMMLIEYGDDILVVDGGLSFPEDGMYGIDLVIPDHTYLIENKDKVRAYLLTHGHEDHIGGMPYILQNVSAPVYGLPLTLGLLRGKLNEHHLSADMRAVAPREELVIGHFRVEFIRVTHSIPDSMGLAIHTPVGTILIISDFKMDMSPIDGKLMDFGRISALGEKGVLLLMSDSTNVEREGFSDSERSVGYNLDKIFFNAKGRIILTSFASHVHRVQQAIWA